jgi:Na+/H+ antiporter NhaD/arsenite permease-like protein
MIVPVVITAIAVFPFLLYIVFNNESLIPTSIKMHELPEEAKSRKPVNPNIPNARGTAETENAPGEEGKLLSLEEIMNPFLDKGGATFGAVVMAVTLVAVLALNAAKTSIGEIPVFYVTLPAAVVTFVWDLSYGWLHRHETREIARKGRKELERARLERAMREKGEKKPAESPEIQPAESSATSLPDQQGLQLAQLSSRKGTLGSASGANEAAMTSDNFEMSPVQEIGKADKSDEKRQLQQPRRRTTLLSLAKDAFRWSQETFPTATAVLTHLPYALIPFAFGMFVLVQALVTKGWVEIFALGWDKWVTKTGVVGAVGGMGFLSVVLCNVRPLI